MSTAVAEAPNGQQLTNQEKIQGWLQSEKFKEHVSQALPKHLTPDRMLRVVTGCFRRVPKLYECDPGSVLNAIVELSSWGLEPNGRDAHLVPYKSECQLILDYKGLVQLCYRAGYVESIHADVVRAGDKFRVNLGQIEEHIPHDFRTDNAKPDDPGEVVAAYAVIVLKGSARKCEVMSKREIDGIRSRSKAKSNGPWVTDYEEMAKKTVFRRASKWLPISAEMIAALHRDADALDVPYRVVDNATSPGGVEALKAQLAQPEDSANPEPEPRPEPDPMGDPALFDNAGGGHE